MLFLPGAGLCSHVPDEMKGKTKRKEKERRTYTRQRSLQRVFTQGNRHQSGPSQTASANFPLPSPTSGEEITDLAIKLQDMDLKEFRLWDNTIYESGEVDPIAMVRAILRKALREGTGDIAVLDVAREQRPPVTTMFSIQLQKISRDLRSRIGGFLVSSSSFSKLPGICDKLHTPMLFVALLKIVGECSC